MGTGDLNGVYVRVRFRYDNGHVEIGSYPNQQKQG